MTLQLDLFAEIFAEEAIERETKPETDARAETVDNPLHGHALPAIGTVVPFDRYLGRVQWARVVDGKVQTSLQVEPGTYYVTTIELHCGEWLIPPTVRPMPINEPSMKPLEKPDILCAVFPTSDLERLVEARNDAHRRLVAARAPAIAERNAMQKRIFRSSTRTEWMDLMKKVRWPEDSDEATAALIDLAAAQKAIWLYEVATRC